jgi:hypothetical protein
MSIWGPETLFLKEHGANDLGKMEGNNSDSLAVYYMSLLFIETKFCSYIAFIFGYETIVYMYSLSLSFYH